MFKRIFLISLMLGLLIVFIPTTKTEAASVYVGVKLTSITNPNGSSCLPAGTIVSVMDEATPLGSKTTIEETCAGAIIELNDPIVLNTGSSYTIKLTVFDFTCSGFENDSKCWYAGVPNQSCTSVCGDKGGNNTMDCSDTDAGCVVTEHFFGAECLASFGVPCTSICYPDAMPSFIPLYFVSEGGGGISMCSPVLYEMDEQYVCACNGLSAEINFEYPFDF